MYGGSQEIHRTVALCHVGSLHGDTCGVCPAQRHDNTAHGLAAHGQQAQGVVCDIVQPCSERLHLSGEPQGAQGSQVGWSEDAATG